MLIFSNNNKTAYILREERGKELFGEKWARPENRYDNDVFPSSNLHCKMFDGVERKDSLGFGSVCSARMQYVAVQRQVSPTVFNN